MKIAKNLELNGINTVVIGKKLVWELHENHENSPEDRIWILKNEDAKKSIYTTSDLPDSYFKTQQEMGDYVRDMLSKPEKFSLGIHGYTINVKPIRRGPPLVTIIYDNGLPVERPCYLKQCPKPESNNERVRRLQNLFQKTVNDAFSTNHHNQPVHRRVPPYSTESVIPRKWKLKGRQWRPPCSTTRDTKKDETIDWF
jgi:hypothetical protein